MLSEISVGKVFKSKSTGYFQIVDIISPTKVKVRFLNTGYETFTQNSHIRRGNVKDHLFPCKFGVGYLGDMCGKTHSNGKPIASYVCWHNMLTRCYDPNYVTKFPTYKGCSVCFEWLNFSTFNSWHNENYIEGFHLDKDLLVKGNKVYSPNTCKFISAKDNYLLAQKPSMSRWLVLSPQQQEIEVSNVSEFCKEKGFSQGTFQMLLSGKRNVAWGWKLIKRVGDLL
jgi:hypothetical protein